MLDFARPSSGSGGWIRTTDLRVMSPTSCHCSTPRRRGHRSQVLSPLPSPLSSLGKVHGPTLPAVPRQYHRRCGVSPPGSAWFGVVPPRSSHTSGSGSFIALLPPPTCLCLHSRSFVREALVHALCLPARLAALPAAAACPVISWGTYLAIPVSGVILRRISHLDAFSGSCCRT